jgi:hypothetical protein
MIFSFKKPMGVQVSAGFKGKPGGEAIGQVA